MCLISRRAAALLLPRAGLDSLTGMWWLDLATTLRRFDKCLELAHAAKQGGVTSSRQVSSAERSKLTGC